MSYAPIFDQISFSRQLPEQAKSALHAIAIAIERPARTVLQLEGDEAEAMFLLVHGQVKITRLAVNGREQILQVLNPPAHFNTVAMFDGGTCPANAETMTDVSLLALPREPLLAVVDRHPALARTLLREFSGRLRHMVNLVDMLALHTVQGRLAALLLEQAAAAERGEAHGSVTHAQMAARLGTVRELISRTLKSFEDQGLVRIERGAIVVLDRAGLEQQSEL